MLDMYDLQNDIWLCHSFGGNCYNIAAFVCVHRMLWYPHKRHSIHLTYIDVWYAILFSKAAALVSATCAAATVTSSSSTTSSRIFFSATPATSSNHPLHQVIFLPSNLHFVFFFVMHAGRELTCCCLSLQTKRDGHDP